MVYEILGVDLLSQCVTLEAVSLRLRGMEGEVVEKYKQVYWLYKRFEQEEGMQKCLDAMAVESIEDN